MDIQNEIAKRIELYQGNLSLATGKTPFAVIYITSGLNTLQNINFKNLKDVIAEKEPTVRHLQKKSYKSDERHLKWLIAVAEIQELIFVRDKLRLQ